MAFNNCFSSFFVPHFRFIDTAASLPTLRYYTNIVPIYISLQIPVSIVSNSRCSPAPLFRCFCSPFLSRLMVVCRPQFLAVLAMRWSPFADQQWLESFPRISIPTSKLSNKTHTRQMEALRTLVNCTFARVPNSKIIPQMLSRIP